MEITMNPKGFDTKATVNMLATQKGYKSEREVCGMFTKTSPQAFNTKLRNNSMRAAEFFELVDKLGYDVSFVSRD